MTKLGFKKLTDTSTIPSIQREGDAAFDLYASEDVFLKRNVVASVPLGIASEFESGYYVSIRDRSGLAINHGLHTLAGVIDSNYRGEWKVIIINLGEVDYQVNKGDRIAQGIFMSLPNVEIEELKDVSDSVRGVDGFGSSGR